MSRKRQVVIQRESNSGTGSLSDKFSSLNKSAPKNNNKNNGNRSRNRVFIDDRKSVNKNQNGRRNANRRNSGGNRRTSGGNRNTNRGGVNKRSNNRNNGRRGRGGKGKGKRKQKILDEDEMDKQLEKYMMKNPETRESVLNNQLDAYMTQRNESDSGEEMLTEAVTNSKE
eukprot:TRINITY_DN2154_c2_g3_i1.p1 TRINITY_DN2154_c2_g3~~TRINITY_DN2154_c2_g3_i1.p1  ORF type:complete len:170 (-),score=47.43 TRINITY_DN2154_c2_g3_i1:734-1243(-)